MEFSGHDFISVHLDNEFGPVSRRLIYEMQHAFNLAVSAISQSVAVDLARIDADALRHAAVCLLGLAPNYKDVITPILDDIQRAEPTIEALASAEKAKSATRFQ